MTLEKPSASIAPSRQSRPRLATRLPRQSCWTTCTPRRHFSPTTICVCKHSVTRTSPHSVSGSGPNIPSAHHYPPSKHMVRRIIRGKGTGASATKSGSSGERRGEKGSTRRSSQFSGFCTPHTCSRAASLQAADRCTPPPVGAWVQSVSTIPRDTRDSKSLFVDLAIFL
jgi:hypothetical protein